MNRTGSAALRGALAGAAGTAMMTLVMRKIGPRMVPEKMRPDEFIPKKVVEWAEEQTGHPDELTESQEMKAAMGAHFAYGVGNGSLYALLRERLDGVPATIAGTLFGTGLWAVGYEGWMPALSVQEATTDKPPRKWPMPIAAHLVYGATTAIAYDALEGLLD